MKKTRELIQPVLDNREAFIKVFPHLERTLEALDNPDNKPGCTSCMRKKLENDILTIIMMTPKEGINISPLIPLATNPSLLGAMSYRPKENEYMPAPGGTLPDLRNTAPVKKYVPPGEESIERECCFDCVCKHLSQALILTEEISQGYPEHVKLALHHTVRAKKHASPRNKDVTRKLDEIEKAYKDIIDAEKEDKTVYHLKKAHELIKDILSKDSNHPLAVWRVIGHLGEAADECIERDPELAAAIRNERLTLMDDPLYRPTIAILLDRARRKR